MTPERVPPRPVHLNYLIFAMDLITIRLYHWCSWVSPQLLRLLQYDDFNLSIITYNSHYSDRDRDVCPLPAVQCPSILLLLLQSTPLLGFTRRIYARLLQSYLIAAWDGLTIGDHSSVFGFNIGIHSPVFEDITIGCLSFTPTTMTSLLLQYYWRWLHRRNPLIRDWTHHMCPLTAAS